MKRHTEKVTAEKERLQAGLKELEDSVDEFLGEVTNERAHLRTTM